MIDMPELDAELQMVTAHIEHICRSNSESIKNGSVLEFSAYRIVVL